MSRHTCIAVNSAPHSTRFVFIQHSIDSGSIQYKKLRPYPTTNFKKVRTRMTQGDILIADTS